LIQAPGGANRAGAIFGIRKPETTGRVGRKNPPSRADWLASLDPGIARYVDVLDAAGIETYESCEGGEGHSYAEPAVRFFGVQGEGFHALAVAVQHGFPVRAIRRLWTVDENGHPHGPYWEIAFWRVADVTTSPDRCSGHSEDDSPSRRHDAPV
jgi:hypothetical protein